MIFPFSILPCLWIFDSWLWFIILMLTVSSLNCRGLNKKLKRKTIFNNCLNYDIILLQETYISHDKYKEWRLDWRGELKYLVGSNHSNGLIILIHEKLNYDVLNVYNIKDRILFFLNLFKWSGIFYF